MTRFLLNQHLVEVENHDPNLTVLQYLREHQQLTGSKEGCASGDCGACTVVIARATTKGLRYQSVNSCIALLGSLHGKQLITVDGLVDGLAEGDRLHPVQQAMVDKHGSQCGFCTPGFVMSLFALQHNAESADRETILTALGGNLCRCTGYKPIVDAALQVAETPCSDRFSELEPDTLAKLNAINADQGSEGYFRPTTCAELDSLLEQHPEAKLICGGTDLALEITQQLKDFDTIIDLTGVEELLSLQQNDKTLEIGAAVSYSDSEAAIGAWFEGFGQMLPRLGSLQIRNRGSLGGNIANASPIGDTPPVLLALEAELCLQKAGEQRWLLINDFFTGYRQTKLQPGEYLRSIRLNQLADNAQLKVYKVSKRFEDDISAVLLAFYIRLEGREIDHIRVAFGGMAATPIRLYPLEEALSGKQWDRETLAEAKQMIPRLLEPLSDVRASREYRLLVAQNLLERAYLETIGSAAATQIAELEIAHG